MIKEKIMPKLKTGAKPLDVMLNGGIENGIISTVYGPAGSGKTNIGLIAAANAEKEGNVIFIDTESSFSMERYYQISGKRKLDNIELIEPVEFEEQKKVIRNLREKVNEKEIKLIVIDSLTMLYRLERSENHEEVNLELTKQLSILSSIARKKNIAILVTNQVYSDFEKKGSIKMVGGDILKYWSKCIVRLDKKEGLSNIRKATLVKHRSLPENRSFYFKITQFGIEETQPEKKKINLF